MPEYDVSTINYNGSILITNLLSGNNTNLVLSSFSNFNSTNTITDDSGQVTVGETAPLGDGRTVTILGSGTVQPGVTQLGLTVTTGPAVDVIIAQVGSQIVFIYPDGAPNLTGAALLIVNADAVGYDLGELTVLCFTRGTMIQTSEGLRPVEYLAPGDHVLTKDGGMKPIRWIGSSYVTAAGLQRSAKLRPIRIRAGALGPETPSADLVVSPQHRILVRSKIAQRMFGTNEVLVAAKQLLLLDGIDIAEDLDGVEYFHFLFDRHEVVTANGAEAESLFTGPEALKAVGPAAREEILALFPSLGDHDYAAVPARALASGRMARRLAVRHRQNAMTLVN